MAFTGLLDGLRRRRNEVTTHDSARLLHVDGDRRRNSRSLEFWHFGVPSVTDTEATAARCEELGFDGLTLTDSQNLSPDTTWR